MERVRSLLLDPPSQAEFDKFFAYITAVQPAYSHITFNYVALKRRDYFEIVHSDCHGHDESNSAF